MACHFLGRLKSTYPFNIKKGKTMPIRKLTDTLYIAPQLTEADVQEAVRLGIQTVISSATRRIRSRSSCRSRTGRRQPQQL